MTEITVNGKKAMVVFLHKHGNNLFYTGKYKTCPIQHETVCKLVIDGGLLAFGVAGCSIKDRYVAPTGRRVAFTKAVGMLPESERKAWYDAWFNHKGVGRF